MKKLERIMLVITVVVALSIIGVYYMQTPLLEGFEARTYDLRFRMRGAIGHTSNIGIVALDEKSIDEIGRFPWSREHYATLIDVLRESKAKALLMDAFFPEEQDKKIDGKFAKAMSRAGIVTLATAFEFAEDGSIQDITISIPLLTDAAKRTAHINFLPDEDGVNRWTLPLMVIDDFQVPSLGLAGAMEALDTEDLEVTAGGLRLGNRVIPVDYSGMMLINYSGPPGTYDIYSFTDIMHKRIPPEELEGKVLFMGATALGIYDMRVSPFYHNTPGVEINAAVADNIVRGDFMRRGNKEALIDVISIIVLAVGVFLITLKLRPVIALPFVAGLMVAYYLFAYMMFISGSWISLVYPTLSILLNYSSSAYLRFMLLDKKANEMRSIFSSYVSKKVVDQLINQPDYAKIGGDNKEVTILFSDVKGYTAYSEKRTPEEVVKTLNEYLAAMSGVIVDGDGTLDKFLGDGIMAYWGAPLPHANHRELALDCALQMLVKLAELHKKWIAEGTEPFSIRVGLNSGRVIAGNIGAAGKKMEYTVIGDTVNLASRLEASAKVYGVTILASQSTCKGLEHKYLFRELDYIKVVGKTEPIRIYEVIRKLDGSEGQAEAVERVERFRKGVELYLGRKWEDAIEVFNSLIAENPNDYAAKVYIERSEIFRDTPPDENWDGVFTRTSK